MKLKLAAITIMLGALTACSGNITKDNVTSAYLACVPYGGIHKVNSSLDIILDASITSVECKDGTVVPVAE